MCGRISAAAGRLGVLSLLALSGCGRIAYEVQERLPQAGPLRDIGGSHTDLLDPQLIRNVLSRKENTAISEGDLDLQRRLFRILGPGKGDEPVQGATFQAVKAERLRHALGHGTLARRRGPVDGDHGDAHRVMPAKTVKYSGKVLPTHSGSLMVTRTPPSAASDKLIAMRWSS